MAARGGGSGSGGGGGGGGAAKRARSEPRDFDWEAEGRIHGTARCALAAVPAPTAALPPGDTSSGGNTEGLCVVAAAWLAWVAARGSALTADAFMVPQIRKIIAGTEWAEEDAAKAAAWARTQAALDGEVRAMLALHLHVPPHTPLPRLLPPCLAAAAPHAAQLEDLLAALRAQYDALVASGHKIMRIHDYEDGRATDVSDADVARAHALVETRKAAFKEARRRLIHMVHSLHVSGKVERETDETLLRDLIAEEEAVRRGESVPPPPPPTDPELRAYAALKREVADKREAMELARDDVPPEVVARPTETEAELEDDMATRARAMYLLQVQLGDAADAALTAVEAAVLGSAPDSAGADSGAGGGTSGAAPPAPVWWSRVDVRTAPFVRRALAAARAAAPLSRAEQLDLARGEAIRDAVWHGVARQRLASREEKVAAAWRAAPPQYAGGFHALPAGIVDDYDKARRYGWGAEVAAYEAADARWEAGRADEERVERELVARAERGDTAVEDAAMAELAAATDDEPEDRRALVPGCWWCKDDADERAAAATADLELALRAYARHGTLPVTLVARDGTTHTAELRLAQRSATLAAMVADFEPSVLVGVPLEVSTTGPLLAAALAYLTQHFCTRSKVPDAKPLETTDVTRLLDAWDAALVAPQSYAALHDLAATALYLGVPDLREVCGTAQAALIMRGTDGMRDEEAVAATRQLLGIDPDNTGMTRTQEQLMARTQGWHLPPKNRRVIPVRADGEHDTDQEDAAYGTDGDEELDF